DDICCEDVINVLNVTGIPAVAFSAFQRRTIDQRNALESSSRVTNEGVASGSGDAVFVHSSSSPQPQSELLSQPEPELLSQPELLAQSEPGLLSQPELGLSFFQLEPVLPQTGPVLASQLEPELSYQPEPELSFESESLPSSHTQSETQLGSLLLLDEDSDRSHSKFVKFLLIGGDVLVSTVDSAVSTLGVLVDESPPISSDERLVVSATNPSSVSFAAIEESSTTVSSSSFGYFRGSGGAAPSGPSESGDDGGEGGAAQSGASVGVLQQVEAPPSTDSAILTSATAAVGKEVSARGKGKASAKKHIAVSSLATSTLITAKEGGGAKKARGRTSARKLASFNVDPVVLDSLGVKLHPDNVGAINVLFYDAMLLAARVYESVISKQLPPEVRDELPVTGQTIWCRTYRVVHEVNFSYRCLREYHAKHRPGFIRSLPTIKVLSNSSESDAEILGGDELLGFLSKLDSAILGVMVSFFNSRWNEATGKILSPLEEDSLSDISFVDFTNVLDIAGVPSIVMSSAPSLKIHASTKRYKKYNKVLSGEIDVVDLTHSSPPSPQSLLSQSESQLVSSLPSEDGSGALSESTHSEAGIIHGNVGGVQPIKCVDLLGAKLHPASAKLVYRLFSNLREAARTSYSKSILNYLLEAVDNSELSAVGRAIWCKMYRE
uniref:hypothetical protein n=1 Tax=Candidatus Ichthyocystis sparus TaxID=1561004 RepID=UPI00159ED25D